MPESPKPGAHDPLERPILTERAKPALDEATFQQLLEAAHVLQEQKALEVASRPRPDPTEALAEIVDTQEFLRAQSGDLQGAAKVIVERLQRITHATGVAVAVVRADRLEYCAATGDATRLMGTSLAMNSALTADGQLNTEFSRGPTGKQSIALPLHHEGNLSGLLEVRFADADSIQPPEMRSCQLMAGLMTEAITRAADKEWKQTLAAERAAMLEALEKIKPQLERLAVESPRSTAAPENRVVESMQNVPEFAELSPEPRVPLPVSESSAKSGRETVCPQCGYQFGEHELFCGRCGSARPAKAFSGGLPSKWASPWDLQRVSESNSAGDGQKEDNEDLRFTSSAFGGTETSPGLDDVRAQFQEPSEESGESEEKSASESGSLTDAETGEEAAAPLALQESTPAIVESPDLQSAGGIWLAQHRADLYVGAAVVLLFIVLSGWGMRPAESHTAVKNPPQPSLTFFEKLLVSLGLAETPPTPVYLGNPNARVWVDLHTALYYCSGSELYGRTAGGKFTTQRDAQMDQFEPAARKNCD